MLSNLLTFAGVRRSAVQHNVQQFSDVPLQLRIFQNFPEPPFPFSAVVHEQVHNSSECGSQYSTNEQAVFCAVDTPAVWPPALQVRESLSKRKRLPA